MSAVLEVRSLSKAFGGLHVTKSVDMRVQRGERHLVIGPNGAGKTTLFNLISGDLKADSGTIRILGQDVTREASALVCSRPDRRGRFGVTDEVGRTLCAAWYALEPLLRARP